MLNVFLVTHVHPRNYFVMDIESRKFMIEAYISQCPAAQHLQNVLQVSVSLKSINKELVSQGNHGQVR